MDNTSLTPSPAFIAKIYSCNKSPAWSPTMVTPSNLPLCGAVINFTNPSASSSAMARSKSSMPYLETSKGMPFAFASCSFRPTRATSGWVKVHHGTTDQSIFLKWKWRQRVCRRRYRRVSRRVGKLIRTDDVAASVDIGH